MSESKEIKKEEKQQVKEEKEEVKQTVKKALSVKIPKSRVVFSKEELYRYKPKLKHVEYTIYN